MSYTISYKLTKFWFFREHKNDDCMCGFDLCDFVFAAADILFLKSIR